MTARRFAILTLMAGALLLVGAASPQPTRSPAPSGSPSPVSAPAFGSLSFLPFGELGLHLAMVNPWHGFVSDDDATAVSVRVERISSKSAVACDRWFDALAHEPQGLRPLSQPVITGDYFINSVRGLWGPWEKEEIEAVEDCEDYPCAMKLDRAEVLRVKNTPKSARMGEFLSRVRDRLIRYEQRGERKEYEYEGEPVDPWKLFESRGLRTPLAQPAKPKLFVRRLDFAPGKLRVVRQAIDVRFARGAGEAVLWVRDGYNAHYFDSWGEWTKIECRNGAHPEVLITQAILLELDTLKDSDLFSRIARPKMREAAREQSRKYLDEMADRLRKAAAE